MRLSCLIPAFNEGPRIGAVLDVALAAEGIDEVIVIDDGSSDDTVAVVEARRDPRLRLLRQPVNGGKTRAVAAGLAAARGQYVLLLDSDLVGLEPAHLARLCAPVLAGGAGAALSLRGNAPGLWRAIGIDYISGERVMPRALLVRDLAALERLPRFGLEVYMNRLWLEAGLQIAVVPWPAVASPLKAAKHGWLAGLKGDAGMMRDIFRTIGPLAALGQIARMRARRIAAP